VDSKKIRLPLEANGKPKCQVGGIRVGLQKIHPTGSQSVRLVGLEWDCTKSIQQEAKVSGWWD